MTPPTLDVVLRDVCPNVFNGANEVPLKIDGCFTGCFCSNGGQRGGVQRTAPASISAAGTKSWLASFDDCNREVWIYLQEVVCGPQSSEASSNNRNIARQLFRKTGKIPIELTVSPEGIWPLRESFIHERETRPSCSTRCCLSNELFRTWQQCR